MFCSEEQARPEIERFCRSLLEFYPAFGFAAPSVALSTRPPERAGDDATWDRAEVLLEESARGAGLHCTIQEGAGAFYGPKLEFTLRDGGGRAWQCGTIQLDFVLPAQFGLEYVDRGAVRRRPVMLHRAIYGSLERFLGVLLEHHAGRLPSWLAPVQVRVLPVSPDLEAYAEEIAVEVGRAGLRCELLAGDKSLARRVALAYEEGVPFVLVTGERERVARSVAVRDREGRQRVVTIADAIREIASDCAPPI